MVKRYICNSQHARQLDLITCPEDEHMLEKVNLNQEGSTEEHWPMYHSE